MFSLVVTALLPVFLGLGLGYFAGYRKLVDNRNVASLNVFLMQFLLPITLFVSIARTPRAVIIGNSGLVLVLACALVLIYVPMLALQTRLFRLPLGTAAVQTLTSSFPNFASIGLPLLVPVFGADAALPVAVAIATGSVTISPLTIALLELSRTGGTDLPRGAAKGRALAAFGRALRNSVRKPIFLGPFLGLCVSLVGIHLPKLVGVAFMPMISATAGTGLFLTGLMLSAQQIRIDTNVLLSVGIKNVVQPLVALGFALLFGLAPRVMAEAVLLCTIPAGFFGLVFGASVGIRPGVSGSTLVVSSVVSLLTLSAVILMIGHA